MKLGALPISAAPIDVPWETRLIPVGSKGLYLRGRSDMLAPEQTVLQTNLETDGPIGPLQVRRGLTQVAVAAGLVHTFGRLTDPLAGDYTRFVGHGTSISTGTVGALGVVDTGYSGDPVTLLPHRPTLSGEPWMIVADRTRLRQIRRDGTIATLGLTAPTVACGAVLDTERTVPIAEFDASDSTQAASWTGNAGEDDTGVPSDPPAAIDVADPAGGGVEFIANPGGATTGYSSFWNIAKVRDLSTFGAGRDTSDDDFLHVWLKTSNPAFIQEVRLYLVCSAVFDLNTLPGTDVVNNADAYLLTWTQNDIAAFIQGAEDLAASLATSRARQLADAAARRDAIGRVRNRPLREDEEPFSPALTDARESWADRRATIDRGRQIAQQTPPGQHQWIEYGVIGAPTRKGDFQRIGSTPGRDWSTITGIVVYLKTTEASVASVGFDMVYLTGGSGPDTAEPGATQLDWRYTHYHLLTGDESNGSPEMAAANKLDALRRGVVVTPTAFGNADVRQRVYQRGGALPDDWSYVGQNGSDGGAFTAEVTDLALEAAPKLAINRYAAIPTQDANGNTVLNQPVPVIFGPLAGRLLALGDPYRPGHLYASLVDEPGAWDPTVNSEVCPPSEQLMTGLLHGGQGFVFSRRALYPVIPTDTGITTIPSACQLGTLSRKGAVSTILGIAFINRKGIYLTNGGPPEWISEGIDSLFTGDTITYSPINWDAPTDLRLEVHGLELWFMYQDTQLTERHMAYHLVYRRWRPVEWAREQTGMGSEGQETGGALLFGDKTNGVVSENTGSTDNGTGITFHLRTGDWFGGVRGDKELGDLHFDADPGGVDWEITLRLNNGVVVNPSQDLIGAVGREQYVLDPFGTVPQAAYSAAVDIVGTATAAGRPTIYQMGIATRQLPEAITRRMTQWDDLGSPAEKYLIGVMVEADTYGADVPITVEVDYDGAIAAVTGAPFTLNCDGRHRRFFSWPTLKAHLVRLRAAVPEDECAPWLPYRLAWISDNEPEQIARWDSNWEDLGDTYYTGLDLVCDTRGLAKTIEVWVDQALVVNPATGLTTFPVTTSGRRWVHLTFGPGRGHVYKFRATDDNPGLLYAHRWYTAPEPSEQANWHQNYTLEGTLADKYIKAVLLAVDTNGVDKTVQIQGDGVVQATITVNGTQASRAKQYAFPQFRARTLRLLPTDANPGRIYQPAQWVFDEEPLALTRWETQETDHGLPGWHSLLFGHLTYRSTGDVTLTVTAYNQLGVALGTISYTLPNTAGVKRKQFQTFQPNQGVLYKYLFTAAAEFYLYREETVVVVQPFGAESSVTVHPFGNDDLDPTRGMGRAALAAAAPGGMAS